MSDTLHQRLRDWAYGISGAADLTPDDFGAVMDLVDAAQEAVRWMATADRFSEAARDKLETALVPFGVAASSVAGSSADRKETD